MTIESAPDFTDLELTPLRTQWSPDGLIAMFGAGSEGLKFLDLSTGVLSAPSTPARTLVTWTVIDGEQVLVAGGMPSSGMIPLFRYTPRTGQTVDLGTVPRPDAATNDGRKVLLRRDFLVDMSILDTHTGEVTPTTMPTGSHDLRWTAGGASVIGVNNTWPNQHVWLWDAGTRTTVIVADESHYFFTSPVSSSNLEFFIRSSTCCSAGLSSAESMIMNPETGEVWGGMWGHAAVPNATETSSAFTPDGEHIIVYDSGDFFPHRELIVIAPHPPAPA